MNNTSFFSFILILLIGLAPPIKATEPSDELFISSGVPYAEYKSVHNKMDFIQKLLLPIDALSFISEPKYFLGVSKYSLLPDPSFIDWSKAVIAPHANQKAYRLFLEAKHDLEEYQDILTIPPILQQEEDDEDNEDNDYDIPDFKNIFGVFLLLNDSLTQLDNAWTRLYRGITLARLRAFQPALNDLQIAKKKFTSIGANEKLLLTERAIHQVTLWQQGNNYIPEPKNQERDLNKDTLLALLPFVQQHNLVDKTVAYWKQLSTLYLTEKAFDKDTLLLKKILPLLTETIGISTFQLALRDVFINGLPEEILQQCFILYKLNTAEQQTLHQLYRTRLQYQEQVHHLASRFFELFQKKVAQQNYLSPQQQQFLWKSLRTEGVDDLGTIAIIFLQLQVGVEQIVELLRTGTQVSTALLSDIQGLWASQQQLYIALATSLNHPNAPSYLRETHHKVVMGIEYLDKIVPEDTLKIFIAPFVVNKIYLKQLLDEDFDMIKWMQAHELTIRATFEQSNRDQILNLIAQFIGNNFIRDDDTQMEEALKPVLLCTAQWINVANMIDSTETFTNNACKFKWFQFGSKWLLLLIEQWTKDITFFNKNPELLFIINQATQTTLSALAQNLTTNTSFSWLGDLWLTHLSAQIKKRHSKEQDALQLETKLILNGIAYWLANEIDDYASAVITRKNFKNTLKKVHLANLADSTKIVLHLLNLMITDIKVERLNSLQQLSLLSANSEEPLAELLYTGLSIIINYYANKSIYLDNDQITKSHVLFPLPTSHEVERIKSPLALLLTMMSPRFYANMSPVEITAFISEMIEKNFNSQRQLVETMLMFALENNVKELNYTQIKALSRFSLQTPINVVYELPLSVEYASLIPYIMPYTYLPSNKLEESDNNFILGAGFTQKIGPFATMSINYGKGNVATVQKVLIMKRHLALLKAALNDDKNNFAEQHFNALLPLDKHGREQTVINHQHATIMSQGARAVLEALRQGHKLSTSLENRAVRLLINSFTKMDGAVKSDPEPLIENLSSLLQNLSNLSELNHDQVMKILPKWIAWAEQIFYKKLYQDTDIFDNSFEDTLEEPWHTYFNALLAFGQQIQNKTLINMAHSVLEAKSFIFLLKETALGKESKKLAVLKQEQATNYQTAIEWYKNIASKQQVFVLTTLSWMYSTGEGVVPDQATAYRWLNKAVKRGLLNAVEFEKQSEEADNAFTAVQQILNTTQLIVDADTWFTLCHIGSNYQQTTTILTACEKAVELAPKEPSYRFILGFVRAQTGAIQEAIEDYKQAEQGGFKISSYAWSKLCWHGSIHKQASKVMPACEKAIAIEPDNEFYYLIRGIVRTVNGNISYAIEDLQVFVKHTKNLANKSTVNTWLKALQQGNTSFAEKILHTLQY